MRKPRIAISPQAYKALRVWAALEDKDPGDMAGDIILAHMPPRVREALTPLDTTCKPVGKATVCEVTRPKQLAKDAPAIAHIKELWESGATAAEIARQIDRPRATTQSQIKRMIEKGDLSPRP